MIRTSFNRGWAYGPQTSPFAALEGAAEKESVTLPHDAVLAGGRTAEGSDGSHTGYFRAGAWQYEKSFDVPQEWASRRVALEFEGVYRDAMIYINGDFAGQHAGGYSSFQISLDPFLRYGESNTVRVEAQAHQDSRWYSGGGITRPVNLLVGGLVHVAPAGLRVTTPEVDDQLAVAAVATKIINADIRTRTVEVLLEIRDRAGAVVATDHARATLLAGDQLLVRQRSYLNDPELWSVDEPNLYTASVRLEESGEEVDRADASFGIRTLSLDPRRGLRINGDPVLLRGACLHHDHGVLGAAAFGAAEERRIRLLKEAGFNAIRSSHNPISPAALRACDRLGMLVMDETFDIWTRAKTPDDYSRRFARWWADDVDALVAKDFNHPSVIFYSIGNEIPEVGTGHGARWGRLLAERIREQDPTRLITNALNGVLTVMDDLAAQLPAAGDGLNDALADVGQMMAALNASPEVGDKLVESASVLDVVGLNYAESRYLLDRDTFPNRIIVGSETFPSMIDSYWPLVTENAHVIGDFTWTGWDYLGESGIGRPRYPDSTGAGLAAAYPWLTAHCGDIDITGRRRPQSYYREIVFGLRQDPYLCVQRPEHRDHPVEPSAWTWTDTVESWTWELGEGEPITVEAYADADEIGFEIDGLEQTRVPVGDVKPYVARAELGYRPGSLTAVAYRDGQVTGGTTLATAAAVRQIELVADDFHDQEEGHDLAYLSIALTDDDGTANPIDDQRVFVELTGPAVLQGLGTARPDTEESFLASECTTYLGRALAVIRRSGESGEVSVTVRCDGGLSATVELS